MKYLFLIFIFFLPQISFSHEGHHHGSHNHEAKNETNEPNLKAAYEQIQTDYIKSIKPIFDQKCAACHSLEKNSPWYAKIPIVGYIVESDRSEAKEHLEISKGFPFAGHGTVNEDLKAIKDSVADSSMPPILYKIFHPSNALSEQEKNLIIKWIDESEQKIKSEQ